MKKFFVDAVAEQINLFDERWYRIQYKEDVKGVLLEKAIDLPSVTTYLEAYPKGPMYNKWLKETKDPDAVRDEAAALGSKMHGSIERILRKEKVEFFDDIEVWERMLFWSNFWREFNSAHKIEYLDTDVERIIYSIKHQFAGTCDLFPRVDGQLMVIDWKSGNFVGDSAEMQVSAYAKALEEMTDEKVGRAMIVQINPKLPNKKKYKIVELSSQEIDDNFSDFQHVQAIWRRSNKNAAPKYKTYPLSLSLEMILSTPQIEVISQ